MLKLTFNFFQDYLKGKKTLTNQQILYPQFGLKPVKNIIVRSNNVDQEPTYNFTKKASTYYAGSSKIQTQRREKEAYEDDM